MNQEGSKRQKRVARENFCCPVRSLAITGLGSKGSKGSKKPFTFFLNYNFFFAGKGSREKREEIDRRVRKFCYPCVLATRCRRLQWFREGSKKIALLPFEDFATLGGRKERGLDLKVNRLRS